MWQFHTTSYQEVKGQFLLFPMHARQEPQVKGQFHPRKYNKSRGLPGGQRAVRTVQAKVPVYMAVSHPRAKHTHLFKSHVTTSKEHGILAPVPSYYPGMA